MANPTKPAAAPTPIAEPQPISGVAPRPLFTTVIEDAVEEPKQRKLNAKTEAEQAAGRLATSQYAPAAE